MIYTITDASTEELDTPLLDLAGEGSPGFPVFTTETLAREYLREEGKGRGLKVAELRGVALISLVESLRAEGIDTVVVDPPLSADTTTSLRTITSQRLAASAAATISDALTNSRPNRPRQLNPLLILSCAECGSVQRINLDDTLPYCCGSVMRIAARDSESVEGGEHSLFA